MANKIIGDCFDKNSGIVYLEDVEILRPDKFNGE